MMNIKLRQKIAWIFFLMMMTDIFFPPLAMALTSGPSQPEFQKFTPASATDMVNIFSGDMGYNIPLFELPGPNGGYPFNLSYTSGITMEQEASWVGLGWDLNAGAMNRNMRGVPDEFDGSEGDHIMVREDVKKNFTVGLSYSPDFEIFSQDIISFGSASVFYNNYKGVGYSIGFGVNIKSFSVGNGAKGAIGLDVTLNTQEGVDLSPSLSLTGETDNLKRSVNFSASFNSIQGYKGLGFSIQAQKKSTKKLDAKYANRDKKSLKKKSGNLDKTKAVPDENGKVDVEAASASVSGGFAFGGSSGTSVTPSINSESQGFAANLNVKIGAEAFGAHPDIEAGGFYRQEELKYRNEDRRYPVYGYNASGKALKDKRALMDFNRENEGNINKYTKSLAIPSYTYDTWTITGQGIGQMVRPHKSYVGFVRDPLRENKIRNFSGGIDLGGGQLIKGGGSFGFSLSTAVAGAWGNYSGGSRFEDVFGNYEANESSRYEEYYYKVHGEITALSGQDFMKHTSGTAPMRLNRIDKTDSPFKRKDQDIMARYTDKSGAQKTLENIKRERSPRSNYVLEVKNETIYSQNPIFKEFLVEYYDQLNNFTPAAKRSLNRNLAKKHHIAGFVAYKNDGLRYVYALPVLNTEHVESSFSVQVSQEERNNGSNGYTIYRPEATSEQQLYKKGNMLNSQRLNITSTPAYPHCFPLTSVLGVDYVDVTNDGVTDDDLGYWVKFSYYKGEDYKWRMPYTGLSYIPGMLSTVTDDMASYMYGQREMYYLQTAETKTHIARFHLKKRLDNLPATSRGSFSENPNVSALEESYCIYKIELFSKAELKINPGSPVPIKTVFFEYDYSLCPGIKNKKNPSSEQNENDYVKTSGTGKLTLKKVWFQYRNNTRAKHNYYEFGYYQGANEGAYDPYAQDVWGSYKHPDNGAAKNRLFPYVDQKDTDKAKQDRNAAMWNLNKIKLPSGAVIELEYEMDDYAYVQNKPAMQLYKMASNTSLNLSRSVYFELAQPFNKPAGLTDISKINTLPETKQFMKGFLDKSGYVYFKAKIDLLRSGSGNEEYVSGYAQVDLTGDTNTIQIDRTSYDATKNAYTRGIIQFKKVSLKNKTMDDHPISIAAWNFFQLSRPELMGQVGGYKPSEESADPSKSEMRSALMSLVNPFKGMAVFMNGFYGTCRNRGYGTDIHTDESYIRLNSQNVRTEDVDNNTTRKIENFKYGGGHRIKKVKLKETESTPDEYAVGVVYDYTIREGGKWTSSGVATYEPSLGGEENALKLPLEYEVDIKLKTNYKLYAEKPFNQSLYPSESVGYRQVTVRSLATDRVLSKELSEEIPTTGQSVYQFYTAKEFPVITDYTELSVTKTDRSETFFAYLYNYTIDYFMGTQGYSIELNDMHGKPKSIEAYPISKEGKILGKPVSGTYYKYKAKIVSNINGYDAWQLVNEGISVMDESGKLRTNYIVGLDYEVINDTRESISVGYNGDVDFNVDGMLIVFPLAFPMGMIKASISESVVQTAVTNKIIYRSGLLDETEQMTDGARVSTRPKVLDKLTGIPVVQTVKNEYGHTLETSSYPAYWHYSEMGPVYQRIGINATNVNGLVVQNPKKAGQWLLRFSQSDERFRAGDELRVKYRQRGLGGIWYQKKGTVLEQDEHAVLVDVGNIPTALYGEKIRGEIYLYRPIDRNQLDVMIGSKTILE